MADAAKPLPDDEQAEIDRAWTKEIRRRAAELDAGRARLVPADEVLAELRELIDQHRRTSD